MSMLSPNKIDKRYVQTNSLESKFGTTRASVSFNSLRLYVNAVVRQWNRLVGEEELLLQIASGATMDATDYYCRQEDTMIEAQLYLITWNSVMKHFADFVNADDRPEITRVWRRVSDTAEKVRFVRNFYEHRNKSEIQDIAKGFSIDGSFHVSYFERGGKRGEDKMLFLGRAEVLQLTESFEEVIKILRARPSTSRYRRLLIDVCGVSASK
jgi:hypothetical protein